MMVGRLKFNITRHYIREDIDYKGDKFLYTICGSDFLTNHYTIVDSMLSATCKKCVKKYNKILDSKNKGDNNDDRTI